MQDNKNNVKHDDRNKEDATKYGEFISSFFSWTTLEKQKEKAEEMQKMTDKWKNFNLAIDKIAI